MKKIIILTLLVCLISSGLHAQYDGGNGRGDYSRVQYYNNCNNPTSGGTIAGSQSSCSAFDPAGITSSVLPTGYMGTLVYKWQVSTTNSYQGFTDIDNSNAVTYDPGTISQTSWYKRLSRVSCQADWTGAAESNVVKMAVGPPDVSLTVGGSGTICAGNSINITVAASDAGVSYQLRNGTTDIGSAVAGTGSPICLPTGIINETTTFNVLAILGSCSTQLTQTAVLTVPSAVSIGAFSPTSTTVCQGAQTVTISAPVVTNNISPIVYSLDNDSRVFIGNSINASTGAVTLSANWFGTATVTATAAGCSGSVTTEFVIHVTPITPTVTYSPASTTICQGSGTVNAVATTVTNATTLVYSLDATTLAHSGNSINSSTGVVTLASDWSGTSTVTAKATGCSGIVVTADLAITTTPTVTITAYNPSVTNLCMGYQEINASTTSNNISSDIVYSLDATTLAHSGNSIDYWGRIIFAADWNQTSTLTATVNGCNGPVSTQKQFKFPTGATIEPFAQAPITVCQGAQVIPIDGTTGANGLGPIVYSLDNNSRVFIGNSINSSTGTVTLTSAWYGTTTVTATVIGCSGSVTTDFIIHVTPTTPTVTYSPTSITVCQGSGTVNAAATTVADATTLVYSLDATTLAHSGNSINSSTGVVTLASDWSGPSTVTAKATGCSGIVVTADLAITTTPTVSIKAYNPSTVNLCMGYQEIDGSTTASNISSDIVYSLDATTLAHAGNSIDYWGRIIFAADWNQTSTLTATVNGCNGPVSTQKVFHFPTGATIEPFAQAPITVCQGAQVIPIDGTTGANGLGPIVYTLDSNTCIWTGNSINPATGTVTFEAGFCGTAVVTASLPTCGDPLTAQFRINVKPTTPIFFFSPTSINVCKGSAPFSIIDDIYYNTPGVVFTLDETSLAHAGNSINASTGVVTFASDWLGTSSVTATGQGCSGPVTAVLQINVVNQSSVIKYSSATINVCQGEQTISVPTTASDGALITYSVDAAYGAAIDEFGVVTLYSSFVGTAIVNASAETCSGIVTEHLTINVKPTNPDVHFINPAAITRCRGAGTVAIFSNVYSDAKELVFSLDATTLAHLGNSINASTGEITFASDWVGTTYVTATGGGCTETATATLEIDVLPDSFTLNSFAAASPICQGSGPMTFTTTASDPAVKIVYSVVWDRSTSSWGSSSGNTFNPNTGYITFDGEWFGTVVITAHAAGCSGTLTKDLTITIQPTVYILPYSSASFPICQGEPTLQFTPGSNAEVVYSLDATTLSHRGNYIDPSTGDITFASDYYGTATLTATVAGCGGPLSTSVDIIVAQSVTLNPFLSSEIVLNQGTTNYTAITTVSDDTTSIWYSLNPEAIGAGNSINEDTGVITFAEGWAGTLTVTANADGCSYPYGTDLIITVLAPPSGGIITSSQTGCNPFNPDIINSLSLPTGLEGTLEYKWQQSTTGSDAGFSDIVSSNGDTYDPGVLTQTTWYKRVVRVASDPDWTGAVESNVVTMTVPTIPTAGVISGDQSIANAVIPSKIVSEEAGTGSGVITYIWESSINKGTSWSNIPKAHDETYSPNALFQSTWFRRTTISTENSVECSATTSAVKIDVPIKLDIKVMLEGALSGTVMTTALNGRLPLTQPYNTAPWNYTGTESVTAIPANIVDWILIEVRQCTAASKATSETVLTRRAAFLKSDGSIVDLDGTSLLDIGTSSVFENLFIVIRHRNHLAIMSSAGATSVCTKFKYDFTTDLSKANGGGTGFKKVGTKCAMVTGDITHDGNIFVTDYNTWAGQFGKTSSYTNADMNLDGNVFVTDYNKWAANFGGTIDNKIKSGTIKKKYVSGVPGDK